jgi:FSR family fosmidomycin resistance protein-like MFS transporter
MQAAEPLLPSDEPEPLAPATGTVVVTGLAALACGHLAVDCCAGIFPVFKTLAHLDLDVAGAIAAFASMLGNGLQVAFGFLGDRGLSKTLMVSGVLLAGAVTLLPYAQGLPPIFALVLATAIGSAAFHPVAAGSASALSHARTGVMLALFLAGGYVGYALSQLTFTAFFAHGTTALMLVVPALAAVGLVRYVPAAPRRPQSLSAWAGALRRAGRPLAVLFTVQSLAAAVNISLIFLLPDFLLQRHAPTWVVQGGGHFALVAGGALALIPAGHASDRLGGRRVLLATNLVTGLLLAGVLLLPVPAPALLVLLAGFGAFNAANNVVAVAAGNRLMPGQHGGVSALLMGLPWCVAAVGPGVAGLLADPARGGTPAAALGWLGLCIPLALVAAAALPAAPARTIKVSAAER